MHRMIDSCLGQNECCIHKKISSSFISASKQGGERVGGEGNPHRKKNDYDEKNEGKKIIKIHMANVDG